MNTATAQAWMRKYHPAFCKPERTYKGPSEYLLKYNRYIKLADRYYAESNIRQAKMYYRLAGGLRPVLLLTNEALPKERQSV